MALGRHVGGGDEGRRKRGLAVPAGRECTTPDQAAEAFASLGGELWVVKAQIHAGGRGKG
ncbi:MAG: ATP-grasp domain-containing protein, partial [Deltaproteobacteria bacterium]